MSDGHTVTPEGLTMTRTIAARPKKVYAAWTRPESSRSGSGPTPSTSRGLARRADRRDWSAVMHLPDGATMDWAGTYTEVDPPGRLAFTMTDDPSGEACEQVTVELAQVADGTEMTLTQANGNLSEEQYERTAVGYGGFFDAMERLLDEAAD